MKQIQICIWFNSEAEEAANFYVSIFKNSKIEQILHYEKIAAQASGQPEGSVMTVDITLAGTRLLALNGGPHFQPNPSISFFVGCESEKEITELWKKLSKDVRMELQEYPFAKKYGWCQDKFGVDWQLILAPRKQKIAPALLFANQRYGKAEEAIRFYTSQFPHSKVETIAYDEKTHAVLHSLITLSGTDFVLMEGPLEKEFDFSPGTSFVIHCDSQEEIDHIWQSLSFVPEAEQCGWLQDQYGISWQVVHKDWEKMMAESDPVEKERLMKVVFEMKKPDLKKLQKAQQ